MIGFGIYGFILVIGLVSLFSVKGKKEEVMNTRKLMLDRMRSGEYSSLVNQYQNTTESLTIKNLNITSELDCEKKYLFPFMNEAKDSQTINEFEGETELLEETQETEWLDENDETINLDKYEETTILDDNDETVKL